MEELMARYLADELSEEERTSFETKLATDESVSQEFEAYLNSWQLAYESQGAIAFDTSKAWAVVKEQTLEESKVVPMTPKKSFSFIKIAATFLVLAVSTYFIYTSVENGDSNNMIEVLSKNEVKEVTLPDGSVIKMNANSSITYNADFNQTERKVTLIGEADFDVMRNEKVPFVVEAGASTIKVLGTNFNVVAYSNQTIRLDVTEGRVAFAPKAHAELAKVVEGGQKATLNSESNEIEVEEILNLNYKGWWTREFSYEGTKLEDVVVDLEKAYWVKFELEDGIKGCPLNTTLKGDIDSVVELITSTFPGIKSSKPQENRIKLSGKSCN